MSESDIDLSKGIPVPGCSPWIWYPQISLEVALRFWMAYVPYIRDGKTWLDFFQNLASPASAVFEAPGTAWILLDGITPGLSAYIHGTRIAKTTENIDEANEALIQSFFKDYKFMSINAAIPDHNTPARRWVESVGFTETGFAPFTGTWGGVPHSHVLYSRFKE